MPGSFETYLLAMLIGDHPLLASKLVHERADPVNRVLRFIVTLVVIVSDPQAFVAPTRAEILDISWKEKIAN